MNGESRFQKKMKRNGEVINFNPEKIEHATFKVLKAVAEPNRKTSRLNLRSGIVAIMILFAALSRLIPHPINFAPIGAMALFGAAYFSQKYLAFLIPVISMWLSDLVINNVVYGQYFDHFVWFYDGFYWTYAAFILIALIGMVTLKKVRIQNLIASGLIASLIFFLVSNFGVWASTQMYSHSIHGLITCYIAGLPFFKNTILGDIVYSGILFGLFELVQQRILSLQLKTIKNQ